MVMQTCLTLCFMVTLLQPLLAPWIVPLTQIAILSLSPCEFTVFCRASGRSGTRQTCHPHPPRLRWRWLAQASACRRGLPFVQPLLLQPPQLQMKRVARMEQRQPMR